ncbi:MAG: CapA family protein [Ruminococcaceae bacterium]|nr:CapA family protein [Oscillospiraceae bacterium]
MKILFASDLGFRGVDEKLSREYIEYALLDAKESMADADFRMLNLETLFNESCPPIVKSGPNNRALPGYFHSLGYMNIDLVGLANNHTGDYGEECVYNNMKLLSDNGYLFCGAGKNIDEAYRAEVLEKDGERVSVIAVCENEFGCAKRDFAGSAGFNIRRTYNAIKREKEKGNYAVVFFHGGNEGNPFPSPEKRDLYRLFIDFGADAVVGMHTHCPEGYEIYKEKPIIYSMGNFFFTPNPKSPPAENDAYFFGYMSELEFENGRISFRPIPYKYNVEKLTVLKGDSLRIFMDYLKTISAPIADDEELEKYFKGWCLIMGPIYAEHAKFSKEMIGNQEKCVHMKNALNCEAHKELLAVYMQLCYEGITPENEEYKNKINALRHVDV